jgi:predicted GH43/DUF377 family glycosyl hydrolase
MAMCPMWSLPAVRFLKNDGTVKIYWGGADTVMCAGTAVIDELVALCLSDSRPPL